MTAPRTDGLAFITWPESGLPNAACNHLVDGEILVISAGNPFHHVATNLMGELRRPMGSKPSGCSIKKRRTHFKICLELVAPMRTLEGVVPLIRHHPERLDGSGYPDILSGKDILTCVRMISIVDIHDALGTKRPYKDALRPERCLAILREEAARGWCDQDIREAFVAMISAERANGGGSNILCIL